jgi:hypothetical protein
MIGPAVRGGNGCPRAVERTCPRCGCGDPAYRSAAERGVWSRAWSVTTCLPPCADRAQGDEMTQPAPEPAEDREAWRDLQDVLEERDREWWADASSDLDD